MKSQIGDYQSGCEDSSGSAAQLDTLVDLVVERLSLARDVAAAKYGSGGPIDDPIREQQILRSAGCALNVSALSHRMGMQFFQDQIEASKVVQRGLYHRWRRHPEEVPAAHPDLATDVRPKLDRITAQIIQQFRCLDEARCFKPGDIADLIDRRFSAAMPERQLPGLHRHAAAFAMRSLSAAEC
jgi:chorismate mutase